MNHIDSHSHLYLPHFDADRDAVYGRMRALSVTTIAVGTDYETSRMAVQSALDTSDVIVGATIGVHPHEAKEGFKDKDFQSLITNHGRIENTPLLVVGVGECGLDYSRDVSLEEKRKQREVFEAQIVFAVQHDLPLMLHVRPTKGTVDAHEDVLDILQSKQRVHGKTIRGTSHFFTASYEVASRYWNLGFATSFPGVVTFAPELESVVREAPAELMLAETDAPYAAPVPHRGKRNESSLVPLIVARLAEIRGEQVEVVAARLFNNTQRIFNIV